MQSSFLDRPGRSLWSESLRSVILKLEQEEYLSGGLLKTMLAPAPRVPGEIRPGTHSDSSLDNTSISAGLIIATSNSCLKLGGPILALW